MCAWASAYYTRAAFLTSSNGENTLAIQEGGIMTISYEHNMIHAGVTFRVCQYYPAIAANGQAIMVIRSTNNFLHFVASVSAEAAFVVRLYEFPWVVFASNYGTNATPINMSRAMRSIMVSKTLVSISPTPTNWDISTLLCSSYIPGGEGNNSIGSEIRQNTEWMLDTNYVYVLSCSNVSGSAGKDVSINIQWYEKSFYQH
jgi:hypothetical protein